MIGLPSLSTLTDFAGVASHKFYNFNHLNDGTINSKGGEESEDHAFVRFT